MNFLGNQKKARKETIEAIKETEKMENSPEEYEKFKSVDELMKDLQK